MKKYYENVILITRGILEKQHRNRMSLKREKGRNMNYVGIDIGSTASKLQLKELGVGLPIREPCIMKTRREL